MSEWRQAQAQLPCGCYMRAQINTELSDEVALIHYGATFAFGLHTADHRAICQEHDTYRPKDGVIWLDDLPHTRQSEYLGDV